MSTPIPAKFLGVAVNRDMSCTPLYDKYQRLLALDDPVGDAENHGGLSWYSLSVSAVQIAELMAKNYYLTGQREKCVEWCQKLGESTLYYFNGDWKTKEQHDNGEIDGSAWFESPPSIGWCAYLESAMSWCSVANEWSLVSSLLEFPNETLIPDSEKRSARAFHIGLASWWRDRSDLSWTKRIDTIRDSNSKKYRMLCAICRRVTADDTAAVASLLVAYIDWFVSQRDHNEQFPFMATFLWNVAIMDGLNCEVAAESQKFLFEIG